MFEEMPMTQTDFHHAAPMYEELPGWEGDLSEARSFGDLPAEARAYVRRSRSRPDARSPRSVSDPAATRPWYCANFPDNRVKRRGGRSGHLRPHRQPSP